MKDIFNNIVLVEGLIENPYMGIIIVDSKGYAVLANDTYLKLIGKTEKEVIGRHVLEFCPNSKLPEILETGEAHMADYWPVNGRDTIVSRFPIYDSDGQLVGAIGKSLFLDLSGAAVLARKVFELQKELAMYKDEAASIYTSKYSFNDIVCTSSRMRRVKSMAQQCGHTGSTVLITGESGTGKELLAHSIHQASPRAPFPFVRVNCAALPENLLESELFGYEEGAFTGARKGGKPGKFELANRGTIFLDEIGDMPLAMQAKLLIVLQEHEVERVGGTNPIKVNVRVIAATNRRLEEMVEQGLFREDLYYRLNVVNLEIPPLRERLDDIPPLVQKLLPKINQRLGTQVKDASEEAFHLLQSYHWPGNVRELENLLERAINLADLHNETRLTPSHFPTLRETRDQKASESKDEPDLATAVARFEKRAIQKALEQTNHNRGQAARILGLHRSALYRKLKKYELL